MRNYHLLVASGCILAAALTPGWSAAAPAPDAPATQPAAHPVYGQPVSTAIHPGKMISYPSDGRDIAAYLVTPVLPAGDAAKRPAVIVAHDIFGMTDWVKHQADALAKQGYTVIVPNLYSRLPNTSKGLDAKTAWLDYDQISDQQVSRDLRAAIDYLYQDDQPTAQQPVGLIGYDMGGIYAMEVAGQDLRIAAAVNYYGRVLYADTSARRPVSPVEQIFNLQVPLLSFYGEDDPQVPAAQVQALRSHLANNPNGIYYEIVDYPGVGHGFLVPTRPGYNAAAARKSEAKTRLFLAKYLRAAPPKEDE